jgi:hypothetical protein
MTKQQIEAVKSAIPLACKVSANGKEFDGVINGRKLDFPVVHFGENDLMRCEISWQLAHRIMTGECRKIIAS